jgi:hypothetical protein
MKKATEIAAEVEDAAGEKRAKADRQELPRVLPSQPPRRRTAPPNRGPEKASAYPS